MASTVMTQTKSIILGAGLLGRLLALSLVKLGHQVQIYDKDGPEGGSSAARVAAAMLAPLAESVISQAPIVKMGHYSLKRWPQIISELSAPVFFQQNGTLILWHRQDTAEAKRFTESIQMHQRLYDFLPPAREVSAESLSQLEPNLHSQFQHGLYLSDEGQLDNRELLQSLHQTLTSKGVEFRWNTAKEVLDFDTTLNHSNLNNGTDGTDEPDVDRWLFDCRGLGAKHTWGALRGVRGEVIRIYAPEVTLHRPIRLIHPRYPLYIAPKENHVFVIGATEIESEDLSPVSVRSTLELLSAAYTVHKGFAEGRILEISSQARPTLSDNLPAVEQLGTRTLRINGLYRHGFLISPAVVDCVAAYVQSGDLTKLQSFGLHFEKSMVAV
jgi:glycine oxidase